MKKITVSSLQKLIEGLVKKQLKEAGLWQPGQPIPPVQHPKGKYDPDKDRDITGMVSKQLGDDFDEKPREEYSSNSISKDADIFHFVGKTVPFHGVLNGEKFVIGTAVFEMTVTGGYDGDYVSDVQVVKDIKLNKSPLAMVVVQPLNEKENGADAAIERKGFQLVDAKTGHVWLKFGTMISSDEESYGVDPFFDFSPA